MFSYFLDEPAEFIFILAGGTPVDDRKHQKEIPILDRIEQSLEGSFIEGAIP